MSEYTLLLFAFYSLTLSLTFYTRYYFYSVTVIEIIQSLFLIGIAFILLDRLYKSDQNKQ